VDLAAYFGLTASLYGYLSLNFMNLGSVPVVGRLDASFGWIYLHTLNLLFPYEAWDYGLIAGIYLCVLLVCFVFLNRHLRFINNLRSTISLCSGLMMFTGVGVYLSQPWFLNVYVISAQAGTLLSWFTNLDLMVVALVLLVLSSIPERALVRLRVPRVSLSRNP